MCRSSLPGSTGKRSAVFRTTRISRETGIPDVPGFGFLVYRYVGAYELYCHPVYCKCIREPETDYGSTLLYVLLSDIRGWALSMSLALRLKLHVKII
jgi:hypothetical protein